MYILYSDTATHSAVVLTPHVHALCFVWPSWYNFGDIVLKFCTCCKLPSH